MKRLVLAYRTMAYITGVLIIVLIFVGLPMQFLAHNNVIATVVGFAHGWLYVVYLIAAFLLSQKLKMRAASPGVILLLLAGIVPVLTFVVERWMMREHIAPALAAEDAGVGAPSSQASPR